MHIAWVIYRDLDARTGGTLYDAIVVRGLREAGDRVDVLSLAAPGRVSRAVELRREIAARRPDVVVGDELCFREIAPAFALPRGRDRAARVLLVHHLTAWEPELPARVRAKARVLETIAVRAADAVIATSATTAERLRRETRRAASAVVRPGCDRLRARERATSGPGPTLAFVGSITARKRVLPLVRAFARAAAPSARLELAGSTTRDAAYAREVERAIAELGVGGRVRLLGERDDDDLASLYARAGALVMPSSLEGFGIAAVEAVYAGTPVIAARTSGLVEALAPCGGAALHVDDDAGLADAIARVTRDADLLRSMQDATGAARRSLATWRDCVTSFRSALGAARARGRRRG
jgi:glycosyltransferase involved in cell wall biosynthesis